MRRKIKAPIFKGALIIYNYLKSIFSFFILIKDYTHYLLLNIIGILSTYHIYNTLSLVNTICELPYSLL